MGLGGVVGVRVGSVLDGKGCQLFWDAAVGMWSELLWWMRLFVPTFPHVPI